MSKTVWHDAKKELPKKSGNYVGIIGNYFISKVSYSNLHKKFNCVDGFPPDNAFDVDYWAHIKDLKIPNYKPV